MVALLLLHVPPPASVRLVVEPVQTLSVPEIADGAAITVNVFTDDVVPQYPP